MRFALTTPSGVQSYLATIPDKLTKWTSPQKDVVVDGKVVGPVTRTRGAQICCTFGCRCIDVGNVFLMYGALGVVLSPERAGVFVSSFCPATKGSWRGKGAWVLCFFWRKIPKGLGEIKGFNKVFCQEKWGDICFRKCNEFLSCFCCVVNFLGCWPVFLFLTNFSFRILWWYLYLYFFLPIFFWIACLHKLVFE